MLFFSPYHYILSLVENGYVNKAVNYDGEMLIIEEIQLYEEPVQISTLRLSASKVTQNRVKVVPIWSVVITISDSCLLKFSFYIF